MRREEKSKSELDLRGVPCPLSWARARVRLESLQSGEVLVVLLDDPKGAQDIPRAAEAQGYAVDSSLTSGVWRLVIQV
jgi:TusA-related sulfurtransferase